MKGVRNRLVWFTASLIMTGASQAQIKPELLHQGMATNSAASIALDSKTEPRLGSSKRSSGLLVDIIKPQQTWTMLNPPVPVRDLAKPMPAKAPHPFNDNLAVHEPDFALLRLSFH